MRNPERLFSHCGIVSPIHIPGAAVTRILSRDYGIKLEWKCQRIVVVLFCGNPALVHPKSRVILAIGIGTQYGLRLPGSLASEAMNAGAKTFTKWSTGGSMDIRLTLGDDWVFGGFLPNEAIWCKAVYEIFDYAA
jgi:hypothetical protein